MVIGMALFGLLSICHSQTLFTNVTANPLWTDTGLFVTNGEWVNVNAAGDWTWSNFEPANDPDGLIYPADNPYLWIFNSVQGGLIAFVGSDPYPGSQWETNGIFQTNQYWQVGTAGQFMSTTNGELWLGINDDCFQGPVDDNGGSNYVTVSLGFSQGDCYSNMTLSVAQVSSNSFGFYISNGIPSTICAIYDSADLIHWTLLDSLKLDAKGSSRNATDNDPSSGTSGLKSGAFVNNTGVPYRFYKVSNGQFWSQAIGFERITVGPETTNGAPGTNALIANQLIEPNSTLNGLFSPMVDGSTLPNDSQVYVWDDSVHAFDTYTYSGGVWSPNGNAQLLPGGAAFVIVTNTTKVTFAGLVPQGNLTNVLVAGYNVGTSSQVPQAGGITSNLGYVANTDDTLYLWDGNTYQTLLYYSGYGWYDQYDNPNPAILNVGEACLIVNDQTNTEYWIRKFPGCCAQ